ncbi:hypothetical protein VCHA50P424_20312 [Vibrio chagasii]|nr:hypothetical protein VCHA39P230_10598 [Vibrio chagasii]CAH7216948.1 hypothetical protein VCHA50P424_20312 [Vibrio chagasii]
MDWFDWWSLCRNHLYCHQHGHYLSFTSAQIVNYKIGNIFFILDLKYGSNTSLIKWKINWISKN